MRDSGTTNRGLRAGPAAIALRLALPLMLSAGLAGCDSGGDDSGGTPVANVTVAGTVTYQKVPFNANGVGLDYGATFNAPVRGAVVEILPTGSNPAPLVTTITDANGAYSAQVGTGRSVFVRVKAQLLRSGTPSWNFRVLNNTNSDALYAIDSATFTTGSSNITQNLNAASGWGGTGYTGPRVAAPFSLLDVAYETLNLVLTANANTQFPPLNIFWSTQNRPTEPFDPDAGTIITTLYLPGTDGGVFVLGLANTDTDEYDQHVIAHELGHYYQDVFSRDDSLGGAHGAGDRLDFRVAFSEGWGNAFSGMVKNDPLYRDSLGSQQQLGFQIDVELNAAVGGNAGWFSEGSVQALVYDFFDSAADGSDAVALGFPPIHQVMTADLPDSEPFTSIFAFVTALKTRNSGSAPAIDTLVTQQQIVSATIDALGSTETNNGGDTRNLPVYVPINVADTVRVCSSTANGDYNGLGTRKFLRFSLPAQLRLTFRATAVGTTQKDPDMVLHRDGIVMSSEDDSIGSGIETSDPILLQPGSYVLEVYDFLAIDQEPPPTDGNTCMDVFVFNTP